MRVIDVKEAKANFKKTFNNDCNGSFAIQIKPQDGVIRIATIDRFFNLRELLIPTEFEFSDEKIVTLSSVDRLDVVWDFIWSKGFWLELYKDAVNGLDISSKSNGTKYTMAEVVFNTKNKRYIYKDFECDGINVIM